MVPKKNMVNKYATSLRALATAGGTDSTTEVMLTW